MKQNQDKAADVQAAMSSVKEGLAGGVPLFTTKNWDDVSKLMAQHLLQVYTGAQSAKESLTTIQQQGARGQ
ncbi:hypothetical protein [Nonomuraea dietziae]|uniref:hypothetical protein n=1 Tax=Nonomuraea dietziae TaxID=65515 RepID=UPI0031D8240B